MKQAQVSAGRDSEWSKELGEGADGMPDEEGDGMMGRERTRHQTKQEIE